MGDVFYPFSLPDEEYGDRILASRIEPDGSSTPPSLPHLLAGPSINERRVTRRHSTVDDTDGNMLQTWGKVYMLINFSRSTVITSIGSWTQIWS